METCRDLSHHERKLSRSSHHMPFAFSKIEMKFLFLGDREGGWEFGKGWDSLHWAVNPR